MSDGPTAPDAAVQIAARAVLAGSTGSGAYGDAREACDALARAGWLHDPAEVERDRDAARAEIDRLAGELQDLRAQLNERYAAALDEDGATS